MQERDDSPDPNADAARLRGEWNDLQRERRQLEAEAGAIETSHDPIQIHDHRARLYAHNCRLYALWEDLERFHMKRGVLTGLIPPIED